MPEEDKKKTQLFLIEVCPPQLQVSSSTGFIPAMNVCFPVFFKLSSEKT